MTDKNPTMLDLVSPLFDGEAPSAIAKVAKRYDLARAGSFEEALLRADASAYTALVIACRRGGLIEDAKLRGCARGLAEYAGDAAVMEAVGDATEEQLPDVFLGALQAAQSKKGSKPVEILSLLRVPLFADEVGSVSPEEVRAAIEIELSDVTIRARWKPGTPRHVRAHGMDPDLIADVALERGMVDEGTAEAIKVWGLLQPLVGQPLAQARDWLGHSLRFFTEDQERDRILTAILVLMKWADGESKRVEQAISNAPESQKEAIAAKLSLLHVAPFVGEEDGWLVLAGLAEGVRETLVEHSVRDMHALGEASRQQNAQREERERVKREEELERLRASTCPLGALAAYVDLSAGRDAIEITVADNAWKAAAERLTVERPWHPSILDALPLDEVDRWAVDVALDGTVGAAKRSDVAMLRVRPDEGMGRFVEVRTWLAEQGIDLTGKVSHRRIEHRDWVGQGIRPTIEVPVFRLALSRKDRERALDLWRAEEKRRAEEAHRREQERLARERAEQERREAEAKRRAEEARVEAERLERERQEDEARQRLDMLLAMSKRGAA